MGWGFCGAHFSNEDADGKNHYGHRQRLASIPREKIHRLCDAAIEDGITFFLISRLSGSGLWRERCSL